MKQVSGKLLDVFEHVCSSQFHAPRKYFANPDSTPNTQTFQLSPILLVSTLDGQLHALDRQTGIWNWTLNDPNHTSNGLLDRCGLVDSPCLSSDHSDQDHELYAIEPQNDGDLYVFVKSSSQPSRLEKLPLSVSQLVNLSPFTFPGDSSKMFIGKKESHLIAIDLKTGSVVNSLNSKPKTGSLKGKEKSSRHHQCHSRRPFDSSTSQTDFDSDGTCSVKPGTSNSSSDPDANHEPIDQRPRDLLYIGRTDYQVSIYSKPNTLIQSLRYSTYTPSNLPHSLHTIWTRTPDELYLEPTHDGNLVCFQAASPAANTPLSRSEHTTIKWQNSFDHPVTSIFDVVFPSAHDEPATSTDPTSRDPGPSEVLDDSTASATKPATLQQPIIFVQPKFLPHKDDQSHSKFPPDDDQFNLFKHLHSQSSFSTPFQPAHSTGQRSAFVGKYQESFYVMSQQSYPLVVFAPSAYQTLGHEPSIGTHHLLNSQAMNGFLDFSYTNRLLDPANSQNQHPSSNPPLALDPPPKPLTLPPSKKVVNSKLNQNSGLSGVPVPSTHTNFVSDYDLPHESPTQLHQRAAQISSLLVRTFKQQLMPSEGRSSVSTGRSDERFPDLNPLLTIFLVLVIMSWWASRKVGSPSTARWDHLHRLVNQALGSNDSSKVEQGPKLNALGTAESRDGAATSEVPTTIPIKESECPTSVDGSPDKHLLNGTADDDSLPASKQKPKRRRGKRPGQKAAAAAAKAEAEAAKALMSITPSDSASSQPGSMEARPAVSQPLSVGEPRTPQKTKPNYKKSKPSSSSGVGVSQPFEQVTPTAASVIHSNANENTPNPAAILFKVNGPSLHEHQPINSTAEFSVNDYRGFEPQRVGSLIVTNETIGYGSHGTVVLKGTFQGRQVAVKRLLKDFVTLASHEVSLLQESDDHPNVVRYFVQESLDNFLYIALELCSASLFDLVEKRQFKEYEELDRIFNAKKALKQISSGLRYLHKLKIVHRDIKPQNILITLTRSLPTSSKITSKKPGVISAGKSFRMLISDFGLCKKLELDESSFAQTANHAAGSFGYRAPEILKGQVNLNEQGNSTASSSMINSTVQNAAPGTNGESNGSSSTSNPETSSHRLTRSIDIFSLGCIYYYVLTKGDHPFGSRYEREMNILKDEICLEQLDDLDEEAFEAQQLIRSMIRSNPKERPTAEEVLQNPYFWEPTKRLNFLCDCSDRFEIMERDPPEEALIRLEDQEQFYRYVHHKSSPLNHLVPNKNLHPKGLDWYKIIDRGLVDNLGKYRKYDGGSIRDLLRVMRNKKHHFQDLPDGIKKSLGDIPEGFLNYFSRKFPSLLVHVYSIILESNLKTENLFATYFDVDEI
ncbi:hypothetical protein PtA15_7A768 [Puccinia triticina]|uniref:non-specific serine/threonine protein kinase n=1 Tax=Puccinia triticina TaxID=208348 RepID=A0ABY7CQV4_9BASI|nr:uncharacterized protein PtA15_7A768 [Puccinia triticina]WAQ87039.1 hypothetical protein PtA15_7A768 [Puccinia triticina]WAR56895.1 hypothetical protein PtB15_7B747 [Puccinia triticina]